MREHGALRTGAHTAMTRAVAESLLASGVHNPEDQMQRYLQWTRTAEVSAPAELKRALGVWQWSRKPNAGSHDPKNLDPHSLPRTLAAALYLRSDPQRAIDLAAEVSRTTQQAPVVLDLCRLWSALLTDALSGVDKATLLAFGGPALAVLRHRPAQGARAESDRPQAQTRGGGKRRCDLGNARSDRGIRRNCDGLRCLVAGRDDCSKARPLRRPCAARSPVRTTASTRFRPIGGGNSPTTRRCARSRDICWLERWPRVRNVK